MALLNYVDLYTTILVNNKDLPKDNRLIFTGDKHIITHGVDYLADYNGKRGLVPTYKTNLGDLGVLGKDGWTKITTTMLPIASDLTANGADSIFTSSQVQNLIKNGFAANDAMVFKGVLTKDLETLDTTSNAFADVPTKGYSAGWTYRVAKANLYAGHLCEAGDWIVATNDRVKAIVDVNGAEQITNSDWSIILTNILGTATITLNGTEYKFATNQNQGTSKTLYAPTEKGLAGQILSMKTKDDLAWISQSDITAGNSLKLGGNSADYFVNSVIISDALLVVTKGTTSISSDIVAKKLSKGLKVGSGLGLATTAAGGSVTIDNNNVFDGSTDYTMVLRPASTTALGGVQIGAGINVSGEGVISLTQDGLLDILGPVAGIAVVSTTSNGLAPKIENAIKLLPSTLLILGYDPNKQNTEPGWYEIPGSALSDTWREILINGSPIGNKILNIKPSEEIHIIKDNTSSSEDVYEIGFGLSWYNINTGEFETI